MPEPREKKRISFPHFDHGSFSSLLAHNRAAVEQSNRDTLQNVAFITSLLLSAMLVITWSVPWPHLQNIYSVFTMFTISVYLFCVFMRHWDPEGFWVLPMIYGYVIGMFLYAIWLAVFTTPHGSMVVYVSLLMGMPLLFIDRPWRIGLLFICMDAFLCISAYLRFPQGAIDYVVNCVAFSIIGLFVGFYIFRIKLNAFEAQRQLYIHSYCDSLTGLYNRRKLFERLTQLEQETSAERLRGVIMLDIDNFKNYNDQYGHQRGDACLRALGGCLLRFGEANDLQFFRYGGEEFLALTLTHSYEALGETAQALRRAVWDLSLPFEHSACGRVTVSAGYAADGNCRYEEYISAADKALYAAKRGGRNMVLGARECPQDAPTGADFCNLSWGKHHTEK